MKEVFYLQKSSNPSKKYMVTIKKSSGRTKTVHFGASGYSDYTIHKDSERMKRYDIRHRTRENWTKSGIEKAGFWSKWILWSKPSLSQAIKYTSQKFNITIKKGAPVKSPKTVKKSQRKTSYKKSPNKYSPKKLLF